MPNPQQPEIRRSERGGAVQDDWGRPPHERPEVDTGGGPIPEANQPGHHPDAEQDIPDRDLFADELGATGDDGDASAPEAKDT